MTSYDIMSPSADADTDVSTLYELTYLKWDIGILCLHVAHHWMLNWMTEIQFHSLEVEDENDKKETEEQVEPCATLRSTHKGLQSNNLRIAARRRLCTNIANIISEIYHKSTTPRPLNRRKWLLYSSNVTNMKRICEF